MQRLEYQQTEDDILQFHLYYSSVSGYHKKQRLKQRLRVPVFYIGIALLFLVMKWYIGAAMLAICAVAWALFFPLWMRRVFRKNCVKLIKEGVGDSLSKPNMLELQEDGIFSSSYLGESKYNYSVIDRIVENDGYTYIFIGKGTALVLPHDRISQEDRCSFVDEVNRRREQAA